MENTVEGNAIPVTYDELVVEIARLRQLNLSTEARLDTATRAKDAVLAANTELKDILNPLVKYVSEQILDSSEFRDAVVSVFEDNIDSRDVREVIADIVDDRLENVSIEINSRR